MLPPMMPYFGFAMITATHFLGSDGAYVDGVWVPGANASTPIQIITPQPVKANELNMLDDGEHVSDYLKSWTADERILTRDRNRDADMIGYDSEVYKVTQVSKRPLGAFRKFIMKRVG